MKDNNIFNKFLNFSIGGWIGAIIGIISTPIITRILSPEEFGKASMFIVTTNLLMIIVTIGTDQSFIRFFYEEISSNRKRLLIQCIKIPSVIICLITLLLFVLYEEISLYLFNEKDLIIIIILALSVILKIINRYVTLVIRMEQKGKTFSLLEVLTKAINFILILVFYFYVGNKYLVMVLAFVCSLFLVTIIAFSIEYKFWFTVNDKSLPLKNSILDIIKYSYPLAFTAILNWLFQTFDRFAINTWSNLTELGYYSAASKIAAILSIIQISFTNFWTPVCYDKYEKNPDEINFYKKVSTLVQFIMILISIICILLKDVVILFLGVDYSNSFYIMPFLIFVPVMFTISETTFMGINFLKKPKMHMLIAIITSCVNIIGNALLVPGFGGVGAGISTAFSYILFFILRTHIGLKLFYINFKLLRLYLIITLLVIYSIIPLFKINELVEKVFGFLFILVLLLAYFKDLKIIYNNFVKKEYNENKI